jgi:hypothetical protein
MYLSFHGFSFDLFGLSRRLQADAKSGIDAKPGKDNAAVNAHHSVSRVEQEPAAPPEISFRGLCIFPIL